MVSDISSEVDSNTKIPNRSEINPHNFSVAEVIAKASIRMFSCMAINSIKWL